MRVPLSGVFRRHSSSLPTAAALDEEGLKIGAALAWISQQGNLDDFPGSRNERLALMTTAIRRGFAAWDRGHDRYKLTQLGKIQAACYSPNSNWAKAPAQDPPVAKSDLAVRLSNRFESRPYTMLAAFFAIGAAVGAAVAWAPSSGPADTRSAPSANSQTAEDSAAPADAHSAPGSRDTAPPEHANPALPPAASSARDAAESTRSAPGPVAAQRAPEVDPALPTPASQEERAAPISGSVAGTRAAGHFDHGPLAEGAEHSASTRLPDPQTISEPKAVPEAQPKAAGRHRSRDAKARAGGAAGAERGPFWSQDVDDGGRAGSRPRRGPDVADDERGAPRYRAYRSFAPEYREPPRSARDDPMGLVGWLFH